jgi:hypothetical protein
MRLIERWQWRYKWTGRMVTSRVHMTEEEAKREHPDAVRVDETRRVDEEPETEEEQRAARMRTDTSSIQRRS